METFLQSKEIKVPKRVHPLKAELSHGQNILHEDKGTKSVGMSVKDFKSSFARSLSFSNNYEESKSLDFETKLPCNEKENENASCDRKPVKSTSLDEDLVVGNFNESFNKSDEDKERQLWSKKKQQHQQVKIIGSADPIFGRAIFLIFLFAFFGDPNKT